MSPDMNWNHIHMDLVKPIVSFNRSKDEELKEAFSWKTINQ